MPQKCRFPFRGDVLYCHDKPDDPRTFSCSLRGQGAILARLVLPAMQSEHLSVSLASVAGEACLVAAQLGRISAGCHGRDEVGSRQVQGGVASTRGTAKCCLGLESGFEPSGLDRPSRLPHQQGLLVCEARLGYTDGGSPHPGVLPWPVLICTGVATARVFRQRTLLGSQQCSPSTPICTNPRASLADPCGLRQHVAPLS